ncbi:Dynein assembly factor 4, axonemal, partial [Cladochytrium tenue]
NDLYLKVNCPPFLFEADLAAPIDADASVAVFKDGAVEFTLEKIDYVLWGELEPRGLNKEELKARRADAHERALQKAEQDRQTRATRKREEHYKLVQQQIDVERAARAQIEEMKLAEKADFEASLDDWKAELRTAKSSNIAPGTVRPEPQDGFADSLPEKTSRPNPGRADSKLHLVDDADAHLHATGVERAAEGLEKSSKEIPTENANVEPDDNTEDLTEEELRAIKAKVQRQLKMKGLVAAAPRRPPRESASVPVFFTDRGALPTAVARETEDAKWKVRIGEAWLRDAAERKAAAASDEPFKLAEKNPIFLKDKGNAFLRRGDLDSAINAYTAALALEDSLQVCHANRALCHLRRGEPEACVDDCTRALELLRLQQQQQQQPEAEFRRAEAKLLARR